MLKLLRERCKERAFNCVFMHHKKGFLLMIINIIWDAQSQRPPLETDSPVFKAAKAMAHPGQGGLNAVKQGVEPGRTDQRCILFKPEPV